MSPEIEDIKRVLAICFRDGSSQTADDLERILSFDMGWMDTETAHDAIKALVFAGWIIDEVGILSPNCDIKGINAPLGWQPRPSRLTDPAVNDTAHAKQAEQPVDKSEVEEKVISIVAEQLGTEKASIQPTSSFSEDLGADSLDTVELVMAFEEEFGTEIPDDEAEKIQTVDQAVDYIVNKG